MKEGEVDQSPTWHDPELPFLDVLEQQVRRRAESAAIRHEQRRALHRPGHHTLTAVRERSGAREQRSSSRLRSATSRLTGGARTQRTPGLHRTSARIARRSLTLVVLLSLIGASAYGASRVFSGASNPLAPRQGAYVVVASGRSEGDSWKLRLYERGGELCRELSLSESEASECASPPAAGRLEATSAQSASRRYVFGVTGSRVRRVRVRVGGQSKTVSTYTPSLGQTRSARLPTRVRFFLAALPRTPDGSAPAARVRGFDVRGRALGSPVPSCVETGEAGC